MVFIGIVTGIRFAATTQNDNDRIEMNNNRYFKFQNQCQDTVMVYPDLLEERDVFSNPRRLRDYSIVLHAIPSELLVDDVKMVFGLMIIQFNIIMMIIYNLYYLGIISIKLLSLFNFLLKH